MVGLYFDGLIAFFVDAASCNPFHIAKVLCGADTILGPVRVNTRLVRYRLSPV